MDYMGVLKRSWEITWKYKILWVFGFFAGGGAGIGSGGGGSSSYRTGSGTSTAVTEADFRNFQLFLQQYAVVIGIAVFAIVVFSLVMLVLSVAARGGLIHFVNEADQGRQVRARDAWRVGFSNWGRVFVVGFLAALPLIVLGLLILVIVVGGVVTAFRSGTAGVSSDALAGSLIGSMCFVLVLAIPAAVLGVMLHIASELGYRYAVLYDRPAVESLKMGWRDLWAKRGAFVMYLVQIGVGLVFGIAVGVVAAILVVPAVFAGMAGQWGLTAVAGGVAVLVLIVPSAAYAAFYHSVWTVFFRRMTGMQPAIAGAPMPVPFAPGMPGEVPPPPMPPVPGMIIPAAPAPPVDEPAPPVSDV